MPWIVGVIIGGLAILAWRLRGKHGGMKHLTDPELKKKKKERIVLGVERGGTHGIRLVEEAPSTIRARRGKQIQWLIDVDSVDSSSHTLSIGKFKENDDPREQDAIFERGEELFKTITPDSAGKILKIKGKLNSRLTEHLFTYRVLIDGEEAEVESLDKTGRALADDGAMYVCPVWPCD